MEVVVSPADEAGAYTAQIVVRDLGTNMIVAKPTVTFKSGEPVKAETTWRGRTYTVTVTFDSASRTLTYSLEQVVRRSHALLQSASCRLPA